jgi:hypothetical protein
MDGEIQVILKTGVEEEPLENLYKFCSYGSYSCLQKKDEKISTCQL